jgi:hypothetical protein
MYSDGETSGNRVFKDRAKAETFAARQKESPAIKWFRGRFYFPVSAALGLISGGIRNDRVSSSVSCSLSKYARFSGIPVKIAAN